MTVVQGVGKDSELSIISRAQLISVNVSYLPIYQNCHLLWKENLRSKGEAAEIPSTMCEYWCWIIHPSSIVLATSQPVDPSEKSTTWLYLKLHFHIILVRTRIYLDLTNIREIVLCFMCQKEKIPVNILDFKNHEILVSVLKKWALVIRVAGAFYS